MAALDMFHCTIEGNDPLPNSESERKVFSRYHWKHREKTNH